MEKRQLGKTDLTISRLGAGLAEIGFELTLAEEAQAAQVLNTALDSGINFLDTAACYGISEEVIGRTIAHRRQEYILSTKCGHVTGSYEGEPWTAQTVRDSIERSLKRMRTDHVDVVHLHSCDLEVLERGEVIQELLKAKQTGKTRYIGYSGDNEAAEWAVKSNLFDVLQTSFNLVDQRARQRLFPEAIDKGMGIIAKRPIANGVWAAPKSPSDYAAAYFERAQAMKAVGPIPLAPENGILLALGFVLAHEAVDTAIIGTRNPQHMQANVAWAETALPIASEAVEELRHRFESVDRDWIQRT
jgi:aryl-alcohol dehydrogenase-like predicted oxidoreductase